MGAPAHRSRVSNRVGLGEVVFAMIVAVTLAACSLDFRRFAPVADADVARTDATADRETSIDVISPVDVRLDAIVDDASDAVDVAIDTSIDTGTDAAPACGEPRQACCVGTCNSGAICRMGYCECGMLGAACCETDICFATQRATCSAGMCVACGANGQLCCTGGATPCGSGLACNGTTCAPTCGAPGQACCSGSCNAGAACISGSCVACGGNGQQCCTNAVCNADQLCDRPPSTWQSGRCLACGGYGEICCATGGCRSGTCTPLTFGDYCMGGPTNVRGGTCNPVNAYCSDGGLCSSDGYCFTCGGYLEPCCSGTGCSTGYTCMSGTCE